MKKQLLRRCICDGLSPGGISHIMSALDAVIGSLAGSQLTLGGFLRRLRLQARLSSLVREALIEQRLVELARAAGLSVLDTELQQAADSYRRRAGLLTAAASHAWLAQQGLSADEFQSGIEEILL